MLSLCLRGNPLFLLDGVPLTGLRYQQGRKVLAYLALQYGRPVERGYLASLLWPETDEAQALFYLRRVLSDLRKALGDDAKCLLTPTARSLALDLTQIQHDLAPSEQALRTGPLLQGWTDDWVLTAREREQLTEEQRRSHLKDESASPTGLLGREALLQTIRAHLTPGAPLTLVGSGGVGKTHLARAVRESVAGPVGLVSFASLAPESPLDTLLQRLQADLGLPPLPLETLRTLLPSRFSLLILDNCEHLRPQSAALIRPLTELALLITSRIPLQVEHEHVIAVPPLPLEAATALFLQRASASGTPCHSTTAAEAICQSVDCLPLAIELAVPRLALMSPTQLQERLSTPLQLLRRAHPVGTAPPKRERQETLEATIQWSYELLNPVEQAAFVALSVFPGTWSLEAAEAVLERPDTWQLLETLVRQSLVVLEPGERPRFSFLATVRAFARPKLQGELGERVERNHARYITALVRRLPIDHRDGFQELERVLPDLLTALYWFTRHAPEEGVALMVALDLNWTRLGLRRRAGAYLEELLRAAESQPSLGTSQASLLLLRGRCLLANLIQGSEPERARALLERLYQESVASDRAAERGACLLALCFLEKQRDSDALRRYAEEAQVCLRALEDRYGEAHAIEYQAMAALRQGRLADSEHLYTWFLALARQQESPLDTSDAQYGLAQIFFLQERFPEAEAAIHEALHQSPDQMGRAGILLLLGELERLQGRPERALAYYQDSLQHCQDYAIFVLSAFVERSRALALAQQREFAAARESLERALQLFQRYQTTGQLGATLAERAWIARQEGKEAEVQVYLAQAAQAPPWDVRHPRDEARLAALGGVLPRVNSSHDA